MVEKKRVVIVGAGVSGLAACKHLLERGCRPTVFEADTVLGGVWARAPACTELQTPRPLYQYSDFPWPESVTQVFPYHRQVVTYLDAYARHFGVLDCIRFGHRVVGMEYDGVSEEAVAGWKEWAGNGEAFGSGAGEWRLSVANAEGHVETHKADFVILCIGRFSGVPNVPTFPEGKGPEAFDGHVIHSMDYAKLGTSKAKEMIRGKRVTVVGYLKSALDIPAECTAHPCTMVARTNHWILPDYFAWGVHISKLYLNRLSELLIHKPGQGFLLSLLATLLTPLRWAFSKFAESYYSIPMKKFDMVPDHSLFEVLAACLIAITPKDHYNRLEEGSIVLKKSKTFTFCKEGLLVEGESSPLKSDIVIFGTGFQGDEKIKDMFTSEYSRTIAVGSASTTVPLYRECIHPKIPQLAVIGYSESISNLYTSELRAKWLVHFMNGGFRLPNVTVLQKDVLEWEKYMKRYSRRYFRRSSIVILHNWYNDHLCRDMGCNPRRKKGFFAELFERNVLSPLLHHRCTSPTRTRRLGRVLHQLSLLHRRASTTGSASSTGLASSKDGLLHQRASSFPTCAPSGSRRPPPSNDLAPQALERRPKPVYGLRVQGMTLLSLE